MNVADFIGQSPMLRDCAADTKARLKSARRLRLRAHQIVFQHGDEADLLYFLLSGRISICLQTLDGRQMALNTLSAGQVIGDIAILDGHPRSASAVALSACEVAVVPRAEFLRLIQADPQLAKGVIERLCRELRRISNRVAADGFLDVQAALAHRLLLRACENEDGYIDVSQEELAQSVGVSRVTANKYLNVWQSQGWISLARNRITLHRRKQLAGLIDQQMEGVQLEGE